MNLKQKQKARLAFEFETWKWANSQRGPARTHLFDAGKIGYCVLSWDGQHWRNQWHDRMVTLPSF